MEDLSKDDAEWLDLATSEYLDNVAEIKDFKDLNKNEKINLKIKNIIKNSYSLTDNELINYLISIGLDKSKHGEIFDRIMATKDRFANEWAKLIKAKKKLNFIVFKESKSLDSIKNHYGISDEFLKYLLDFEGTNNGRMGKGEFLLACTIENALLPTNLNQDSGEVSGDIIIDGEKYELKGSHAKIGDTSVQADLLMNTIRSMIKEKIREKEKYLVNKEILPAFYAKKGSYVPVCDKQVEYETKSKRLIKTKTVHVVMTGCFLNVQQLSKIDSLFKEQFKYEELPEGETDEKWWDNIKNQLLIQIFVKMFFTLYGTTYGTSVDILSIFSKDPTDLNIDIEKYKKLIFKTAMSWYSDGGKKFKEIIIIDPNGSNTVCCISTTLESDGYEPYIKYFTYPTFGGKEGATRSDVCLSGPADVSVLQNVKLS